MANQLEKEFKYYVDNQDKLVKNYNGKYIVIKDSQLIGSYDTEWEAIEKTSEEYELGTFLVKKCESGEESYTQSFNSRVAFS